MAQVLQGCLPNVEWSGHQAGLSGFLSFSTKEISQINFIQKI
jgi:hypothetical protein